MGEEYFDICQRSDPDNPSTKMSRKMAAQVVPMLIPKMKDLQAVLQHETKYPAAFLRNLGPTKIGVISTPKRSWVEASQHLENVLQNIQGGDVRIEEGKMLGQGEEGNS